MRTFVIEGKPLEEVTIKMNGQSLTLTEGVEVTVIVVVASQHSVYSDVCHLSPSKTHSWYGSSQGLVCEHCGTRR